MRLFIAIRLNEEIKKALANVIDSVQLQGVQANFTQIAGLHLTLAFLGEIPSGRIRQVEEAIASVHFEPFELALEGTGNFGSLLWVGLKASKELSAYVKALRFSLKERRIAFDEKPFKPHITIARRVKGSGSFNINAAGGWMQVKEISLMKSERIGGAMKYTELFFFDGTREAYQHQ